MTPTTETAIIEKLESLGIFKSVLSVSEVAGEQVNAQLTPAAYVGFGGYSVEDSSANHTATKISETWNVYIVAKNARQRAHKESRGEALTLARSAFVAIAGLIPEGARHPLEPVSPSERVAWASGFTWITLSFSHQSVLKA